jgi:hypothetical protein
MYTQWIFRRLGTLNQSRIIVCNKTLTPTSRMPPTNPAEHFYSEQMQGLLRLSLLSFAESLTIAVHWNRRQRDIASPTLSQNLVPGTLVAAAEVRFGT